MGGNVAWTVRLADSTEYRMQRWTNIFSGGLRGATSADAFLRGDAQAVKPLLKEWLQMKADWGKNKGTGKFKYPMTEVYAPYPYGLRPAEYGFILTDFVTKAIVSCQHYTSLDKVYVYRAYLTPDALTPADRDVYGDPLAPQYVELKQLYDAGRITHYRSFVDAQLHPIGEGTFEVFVKTALEGAGVFGIAHFTLLAPWQLLKFNGDVREGRRAALAKVRELGFELNEEEDLAFRRWAADEELPEAEEP
jgi:hypothetical protein